MATYKSNPAIVNKDLTSCPINPDHLVSKLRLAKHLVKCKRNNPQVQLHSCPFFSSHLVTPQSMEAHLSVGEYRSSRHRENLQRGSSGEYSHKDGGDEPHKTQDTHLLKIQEIWSTGSPPGNTQRGNDPQLSALTKSFIECIPTALSKKNRQEEILKENTRNKHLKNGTSETNANDQDSSTLDGMQPSATLRRPDEQTLKQEQVKETLKLITSKKQKKRNKQTLPQFIASHQLGLQRESRKPHDDNPRQLPLQNELSKKLKKQQLRYQDQEQDLKQMQDRSVKQKQEQPLNKNINSQNDTKTGVCSETKIGSAFEIKPMQVQFLKQKQEHLRNSKLPTYLGLDMQTLQDQLPNVQRICQNNCSEPEKSKDIMKQILQERQLVIIQQEDDEELQAQVILNNEQKAMIRTIPPVVAFLLCIIVLFFW